MGRRMAKSHPEASPAASAPVSIGGWGALVFAPAWRVRPALPQPARTICDGAILFGDVRRPSITRRKSSAMS